MAPYQILSEALARLLPPEAEAESALAPPSDPTHGDLSTPVAFSLARLLKRSPQSIAEDFCTELARHPLVQKAEALSGYINLTLEPSLWQSVLKEILTQRTHYGTHTWAKGRKANVEYVSANPTGPFHAAHSRGAILGDALANLLEAVGYEVAREYFINDAGRQIQVLAQTMLTHCLALQEKQEAVISPGLYPGEYVRELAQSFIHHYPSWTALPPSQQMEQMGQFAVQEMMISIQKDLALLGIHHTLLTSEKRLQQAGLVDQALQSLGAQGLTYWGKLPPPKHLQTDPALQEPSLQDSPQLLLFRSTAFGDSQDHALTKADGTWTYFASDIAYHEDKARRTKGLLIDVWGADHDGHIKRTKAATKAVSGHEVEILIFQVVHFLDQGRLLKMSKRAGTFITLKDLLTVIEKDALKFMMLTKKADTHLEIDVHLVKEQNKDNPVFYVNYAYARCCSILKAAANLFSAEELKPARLKEAALSHPAHLALLKILGDWPRQVEQAALAREPHRIPSYLYKVAQSFHSLWQQGTSSANLRFLQPEDRKATYGHVALVQACAFVLEAGMGLLGITPPKELR